MRRLLLMGRLPRRRAIDVSCPIAIHGRQEAIKEVAGISSYECYSRPQTL